MQLKHQIAEESRPMAEALLKHWLAFHKFLRLAMSEQPITREQDQAFLQIKSAITRTYSQLRNRLPRALTGSPERMQDLMKQALSVSHVRNLPASDRRGLYRLWHAFYVEMCRAVGALKYMVEENYYPKFEEKETKASANIKATIAAEQREGKRKR